MVQASMSFTVSGSKRLIAKAVVRMPVIQNALKNGKVIVTKGTTNTYIAEELLNTSIEPGSLVIGKITPQKEKDPIRGATPITEVILVNGEHKPVMTLDEALQQLEAGDVVIKGANALDYQNKTAGVLIGAPGSGTTGKIMPNIVASRAHLVIPIGLEKQVSSNVVHMHLKMREPITSLNDIPSMFLLTGHIVTELEAMHILAGVEAFQSAAGGIGGAEGGVWLIVRGDRKAVEKAMELSGRIQGEPPFISKK